MTDFEQRLADLIDDAKAVGATLERGAIREIIEERAAPQGSPVQMVLDEIIDAINERIPVDSL